jgi:conjugative relaxase-like TrwC/TraI family protein
MHGCCLVAVGGQGRVALPVKALKAGQEAYWLDQIARNREEYFSGRGESPGRFVGAAAAAAGLQGEATPEQVRAMFQGLDPATGELRCGPLWRADPRSKLPAGPLLEALKARAAEHGVDDVQALAPSKALKGDVRAVQAACRPTATRRVKVETVDRLCRKILGVDPHVLYGESFDKAWQHKGKRVDERVRAFDHCFSSPKSVSLLAAAGGPEVGRQLAAGRAEALQVAIGFLEAHGIGVRRDHNGTDRYQVDCGVVAVAFEHRLSRAGQPDFHTHVLVQNVAQGPDGRWTALDSDRLYAHLMAADHLFLAAERAALTQRLGVRWGPVDERSGAAEIVGLDDRALIERFSTRSAEIHEWLAEHGLSGIKASSAAAVATRAPKDHSESEQSVYQRWARELRDAGVGERELAAACSGGRGRPATDREVRQVLDELAGPEGLTAEASTFTRADVVDALAKRLPVASSAPEALTQVERLADRFLAERAVRVGRDQRLGGDRYSTPELLQVERTMIASLVARKDAGCGQVRPEVVRAVLDRHPSAGADQAAMVQDVCRSGAGVSVVVGRAGSGKTWALGLAREAFELDGYRVLGTAPTGIATIGLGEEGFLEIRTVDRLLLDLQHKQTALDGRTVLVVDEAAMVGTRKLAPLLDHADRAGAKVVLVGDDRQFASIQAGGGFRALRQRLGASELTVNRRQVQEWEQQAIQDVRAGNIEQAIAAYAEHDRLQAFDARDNRDRAVLADWWQAHQAGEEPVIYAHRRAQVDQLNQLCQQLHAEHGQLGRERLSVGDLSFAVGDRVVLGANALQRLGVVNGTSAEIAELDTWRRTLTVHTLEDDPKTVTLPRWYLDQPVQPGQSRRVDLAYARTDMRSQGRTERRALLALDGAEDMQGGYVQVSRAVDRTDFYLLVGPEPLDREEAHPHPQAERLLARVLTRDGSKTLAADTPLGVDVRRLSTKQLREQRDQLAELRASCPPDRSRELQHAQQRAADLEAARQAALAEQQAAVAALAKVRGRLLHRREQAAARDRLTLAEHALKTVSGQADQAAERVGMLRRAGQARAGWLEQHAELPLLERAVTRELGWRGRVDQQALALDPPGWLLAELGPVPTDPRERAVWRVAAAELDGFRRAYGLQHDRPAKHRVGERPLVGRETAAAAADRAGGPTPTGARATAALRGAEAGRAGPGGSPLPPGGGDQELDRPPAAHRDPPAAGGRHRVDADRLLGAEPRRDQPGRRRDWQQARATLQRLAEIRERARDTDRRRDPPAATREPRTGRDHRAREREER